MSAGLVYIGMFLLAACLLFCGHFLRATRWGLLLGKNNRHELKPRFTALAIGYVVNAIIPLRVGEFVRAFFFAHQTKTKLTRSFASIIIERGYDFIAVAIIMFACACVSIIPAKTGYVLAFFDMLLAAIIFSVIFLLEISAGVRKLTWRVANIFNERIRFVILDTAMCLTEIQKSGRSIRGRFIIQSIAMWLVYTASYQAIAFAVQMDMATVLQFFFGSIFTSTIFEILGKNRGAAFVLGCYALAPCVAIILYTQVQKISSLGLGSSLLWLTDPPLRTDRKINERFGEVSGYDAFLCRHFSGEASITLDFETHAIQDATIIRRLPGGSDAVTAVVQVGPEMRFRKYALHDAAKKLEAQYQWLGRHKDRLPLVSPINGSRLSERFFYDMPYSLSSRDFYDFIHTSSPERSWGIIEQILETVCKFHNDFPGELATDEVLKEYISSKVTSNLDAIKDALPYVFSDKTITINDTLVPLEQIEQFASQEFLLPRMSRRETSVIHGDLTIENIIFDPTFPDNWCLIDPNIGNIFESPLLDYAKMFQSLHLGYEALNRNNLCVYSQSRIEFVMSRSAAYEALLGHVSLWVKQKFGEEAYREIRLHEIIHYFRLVPYKIRKAPHAGLLFFGCLALLINKYFNEFEKARDKAMGN